MSFNFDAAHAEPEPGNPMPRPAQVAQHSWRADPLTIDLERLRSVA